MRRAGQRLLSLSHVCVHRITCGHAHDGYGVSSETTKAFGVFVVPKRSGRGGVRGPPIMYTVAVYVVPSLQPLEYGFVL